MAELEPPSRAQMVLRLAALLMVFLTSAVAGGLFLYGVVQVFSGSFTLLPATQRHGDGGGPPQR